MANEIRVRPDGHAVAIASAHADGPFAGYSVMDDTHGGHWEGNPDLMLKDWAVVTDSALGAPGSDGHIRVSPDGNAVAIVSSYPAGTPAAGFGVAHDFDGQRWEPNADQLADWAVIDSSKLVAPAPADTFDAATGHEVVDAEVIPDHPELESQQH